VDAEAVARGREVTDTVAQAVRHVHAVGEPGDATGALDDHVVVSGQPDPRAARGLRAVDGVAVQAQHDAIRPDDEAVARAVEDVGLQGGVPGQDPTAVPGRLAGRQPQSHPRRHDERREPFHGHAT
jgi:hypothetical protein